MSSKEEKKLKQQQYNKTYYLKNKKNIKQQIQSKKKLCIEPNCKNKVSYASSQLGNGRCKTCSNRILSKIKHKENCECFKCVRDGRFKFHKPHCPCFMCKSKRGEPHDPDCKCCSCSSQRGEYQGDKNGRWNNGSSFLPYSKEFTEQLKESIRKRDNYICQNCGMTEEEHLIVVGSVLHIHHIDYDKMNCGGNNLITLCLSCNTRANSNRDYWKEYYQNKLEIINERNKI
jgi:hypothetical protein